MSKGLDALKYLKEEKRRHWIDGDKSTESLDAIEKELKTLEIIKKQGYVGGLICALKETKDYEEYNRFYINQYTKEEYDLLREVLL